MDREAPEIHIDAEKARGGSTPHIVRYVLAISLFLAIITLSVIWITGALNSSERDSQEVGRSVAAAQNRG